MTSRIGRWMCALLGGFLCHWMAATAGLLPTAGTDRLQLHADPREGGGVLVSRARLEGSRSQGLSVFMDSERQVELECGLAQFAGFRLRQSDDLVHWTDTGIRLDPDHLVVKWGPPSQTARFFRVEPDLSLALSAPAADATTLQIKWPPLPGATEYQVFRDGANVGSTADRTGHYLDTGLAPGTTHEYRVKALDQGGHVLGISAAARFSTLASSHVRTNYTVLVVGFYEGVPNAGELAHIRTYLQHRLDFIRHASVNSAVLHPYCGDLIVVQARPPTLFPGPFNIDYAGLAVTPYAELDGYSMVDLVEKGDVDAVWVVAAPDGCNFHENALVGNHDLNPNPTGEKWNPAPAKCSRSFFVNSYSADARSYDAYAHMVEGIMTTISDGYTFNWPADYSCDIYSANREDFITTFPAHLRPFERFRLGDSWNGGAFASKGHGNCGSSHFPPTARRDVDGQYHGDYAYYDLKSWQRYIDCASDDWLHYPEPAGPTRKLNGYDFGAFNQYNLDDVSYAAAFGASPELHPTFAFGTDSFHLWWFFHLPHHSGVTDGKLNNWWPYLFDFNRFNGSTISYPVDGFPDTATMHAPVGGEYGTELPAAEAWGYWHSRNDFGPYGRIKVVDRLQNPGLVHRGQHALEVAVDQEIYQSDGRNDLVYPISRNAHWDLSHARTISFAVKLDQAGDQLHGVNPVVRIGTNGGNRLEFVPVHDGRYADFLRDARFRDAEGWLVFQIPITGSQDWELNVIGYVDTALDPAGIAAARQDLARRILAEVNYLEVSVRSIGTRGDFLRFYLDDLQFSE